MPSLLTLAVLALVIPSFFSHSIGSGYQSSSVEALSLGVAVVMILLYVSRIALQLEIQR